MGVKKQIWPSRRHFFNRTDNKWPYMLALLSFLSVPSLKEIQLVLLRLTALSVNYIQDGRQAAILNDIKNLFDVHNPQTIPDLGVKFQTI